MDIAKKNQILLAKILGEIYRTQLNSKVSCPAGEAKVYGLLNGFEHVIDEELEGIGYVSQEALTAVINTLDSIFIDDKKLKSFKGFYDIEDDLRKKGVDRWQAIRILTYLNANHQFQELIAKMDTSGSPSECRTFKLDKWES